MIPKVQEARSEAFRSTTTPSLLVGKSVDARFIETLLQFVRSTCSSDISPAPIVDTDLPSPAIIIGAPSDAPALAQAIECLPTASQMHIHREGYVLDVSATRIVIAAPSPEGIFYGVQALLERAERTANGFDVAGGRIVDWPTMKRRGFHYLVKGRHELPDFEDVITRFMPQFRLNEIILEINYHYDYQSHPEVREGDCWTAEDCRRLKQLADANCVKIIPMINCLGHQSWADETFQLLRAHPEFDETPDIPLSNKEIYCRSWCPLHPDVNAYIFDLVDELIDVFEADCFHAGMDEVFILGRCPRCREIPAAELFARSVKDIHAHVVGKHGLEMLIWGDRLLDSATTGYGEWEASANNTAPAIDMIPKDIVICDWHYETEYSGIPATYSSVREFQKKGLRVWPAGWKSAQNAQMLASVALETGSDLMVGYLVTTWTSVGAVSGGLRGDKKRLGETHIAGIVEAVREGSRIAWEGTTGLSTKAVEERPEPAKKRTRVESRKVTAA